MKKIYLISVITIILGLLFAVEPDWFKFLWGWQILLLPLTAGILMVLVQNEDRSYRFLPKLIIGSILTSFVFIFLCQIIEYDHGDHLYILQASYTALFLSGICIFGGLIGIVIRGVTLLLCKNNKSKKLSVRKKYLIFGIFIVLFLFLWSPWMMADGGKNAIGKVQTTADYSQIMNNVSRDIFCDGFHTVWAPFGRKVKYCDRADWYVTFWGKVVKGKVVEYVRDLDREKLVKRFDFYIDGGKDNFCRNWNLNYPIMAVGRLVSITTPEENKIKTGKDLSILRFRGEEKEQNFLFPAEKINPADYRVGAFYEIDMNNVCVYYAYTEDDSTPSKYLEEFVYPKLVSKEN